MSIARVVLFWDCDGVQMRNVLAMFHPDTEWPDGAYVDIAAALTEYVSDIGTQVSTLCELVSFTWQDVTGVPPYNPPLQVAVGAAGGSSNDLLPTQIAMYGRYATTNPFIRYGGFYQGGFVESSTLTGVFAAAAVTQVENAFNEMRTNLQGADLSIAVARIPVSGPTPTQAVVISGVTFRSNPSSLRSRKRGVGI